ncbi:DUF3231 family protein [Bacillus infantis]|uniref:DUF3231 family protein n=1 Tax=Bacillus infantis TaxID=324767 RepID=UPI003CEF5711
MENKPAISSSELGTLWMTYQQKSMIVHMLPYFIKKAEDPEGKELLQSLLVQITPYKERIERIFQEDGAVVPIGFTSQDVNPDAPVLYQPYFDIHFFRLMKEISMGLHTFHLSMAFREDIITLYRNLSQVTQEFYQHFTQFLLKKGLLPRPPSVTMPKDVEMAEGTGYMKGNDLFGNKRSLNTVEVAHLYHAIESNVTGMQMITGFAQTAKKQEVRDYFNKGKDLSQKIIVEFGQKLTDSDIQVPSTSAGYPTSSTEGPFTDKLMLYCTSLLCSFGLGSNAIGTAFSLRNDLPLKMAALAKDIYTYGHDGGRIMAKNGWMEEPPQMEDRNTLI